MASISSLLLFQNCTPFQTATGAGSLSAASNGVPNVVIPGPTVTPPNLSAKAFAATEWQPFDIQTPTGWVASDAPTGAIVDSTAHEFRWIPAVGQAGSYAIHFVDASGAAVGTMTLTVSALPAAKIAKGPADGPADGDVGFIFVHGMSIVDYCSASTDLADYWGNTPSVIARSNSSKKTVCYDGRASVESQAAAVASQIMNADCGRYGRCIVVTHSMGGLMLEFMLTHARNSVATDAEPALFNSSGLYAAAKKRILAVVRSLRLPAGRTPRPSSTPRRRPTRRTWPRAT